MMPTAITTATTAATGTVAPVFTCLTTGTILTATMATGHPWIRSGSGPPCKSVTIRTTWTTPGSRGPTAALPWPSRPPPTRRSRKPEPIGRPTHVKTSWRGSTSATATPCLPSRNMPKRTIATARRPAARRSLPRLGFVKDSPWRPSAVTIWPPPPIKRGLKLDPAWPKSNFDLDQLFGGNAAAKNAHLDALAAAVADKPADPDRLFVLGVFLHFDGQADRAATIFDAPSRSPATTSGTSKRSWIDE